MFQDTVFQVKTNPIPNLQSQIPNPESPISNPESRISNLESQILRFAALRYSPLEPIEPLEPFEPLDLRRCYSLKIQRNMKMMKIVYLIAVSLFLVSCGGNDGNRNDNDSDSSHMGMQGDSGFHKKHVGDLHNAMTMMAKDIKGQQFSGDADYDFALLMKRHHQGSLDMAKCLIDNGENAEMKALATKIRDRQLHDIQEFDLIIQDKTNAKGNSGFSKKAVSMLSPMHEDHAGETLENAYAVLMINHHREAVRIAEAYLKEKRQTSQNGADC